MTLDEYLISTQTSQTELAARLGVTHGMVRHWLAGRNRITAERAIDIEHATGGAVTREELRPDVFGVRAVSPARQGRDGPARSSSCAGE